MISVPYPCSHPRTPENTYEVPERRRFRRANGELVSYVRRRCRTCLLATQKRWRLKQEERAEKPFPCGHPLTPDNVGRLGWSRRRVDGTMSKGVTRCCLTCRSRPRKPSLESELTALDRKLAAHGRCKKCGLLEPHECVSAARAATGRRPLEVLDVIRS